MRDLILSWDGWLDEYGKWSGVIREHDPADRHRSVLVWERHNAKSEYHLSVAQEAAHQRLVKKGVSKFQPLSTEEQK